MRISDWSSDVCSSDLACQWRRKGGDPAATAGLAVYATCRGQNLCLAGRRDRQRLCHAVHLLHAISSVCAAHLYHVAVASRHLRGIRHPRSEEHTSELQSLMRISYAVFCLKKKKKKYK